MRRQRYARLQAELAVGGLDGLVLLGSSAVTYATGAAMPAVAGDRAALFRAVAVVAAVESAPHLYTVFDDGVPPEVQLHGPLFPDLDDAMAGLAAALGEHFVPGARVGVDHLSHPMLRGLSGIDWVDASTVLGAAKLVKTVDEVSCIRQAQRLNELAMVDALRLLRPGVRQTDLTALFLRRVFELGASAGGIDPIWQVMARVASWDPGRCTVIWPTRPSRLTGSCAMAMSSGWTPVSCGRGTCPTMAAPGLWAPARMLGSSGSFVAGGRSSTRVWRSLGPGCPACGWVRSPSTPTMVSGRGSSISILPTAWAPTAPKCP
ncbi:creatinase/Prolidase N-terminal domain protein [Mycobacterium kansasii]|uniref:Creatinase/Prolidase N-terminal domain protein n=1 Tax=Mycobacterium kansasii TaxID=1768 RepID=A0A1V3WZI2_MYCKA|nr:creatinase/Prolidase N-terminal domain protein [Mycobacterium kansasii]